MVEFVGVNVGVKRGGNWLELYFRNSQKEERLIAECNTIKAVHEEIKKFLDERKYISHYMRSRGGEEGVMIDVGSWSEFFIIKGISYIDYIKGLEEDEPEEEYHQITFDEYLESLQKDGE